MSNSLPSAAKQNELKNTMLKLNILESDLEESFTLGSGKGGQKQNKTNSCVVLKHTPTNIVVKCQKTRSREANRFFARRQLCDMIDQSENQELSTKQLKIVKLQKRKKKRKKRAKEKYE